MRLHLDVMWHMFHMLPPRMSANFLLRSVGLSFRIRTLIVLMGITVESMKSFFPAVRSDSYYWLMCRIAKLNIP